ncbi:MAG: FG-GAP repeat protein [Phycisphaerae bacterium]|nr:FG-GAP repeat protein [Phycisphaerae bacterium]
MSCCVSEGFASGSSGSAYLFERDGTSWHQQLELLAADGTANDRFGCSVSISGIHIIVGAKFCDSTGSDFGSAYYFGTRLCPPADLTGDCSVELDDLAIMANQWLSGKE